MRNRARKQKIIVQVCEIRKKEEKTQRTVKTSNSHSQARPTTRTSTTTGSMERVMHVRTVFDSLKTPNQQTLCYCTWYILPGST